MLPHTGKYLQNINNYNPLPGVSSSCQIDWCIVFSVSVHAYLRISTSQTTEWIETDVFSCVVEVVLKSVERNSQLLVKTVLRKSSIPKGDNQHIILFFWRLKRRNWLWGYQKGLFKVLLCLSTCVQLKKDLSIKYKIFAVMWHAIRNFCYG